MKNLAMSAMALGFALASGAMAQKIPAGTVISVRTIDRIDSKESGVGRTYQASLVDDVVVGGRTIAARGANAQLRVVEMKKAGKVKGNAELAVTLDSLTRSKGTSTRVSTQNSTSASGGKGKDSALKVGIGAGIGAAIGAIAGGGKGAAIGAGVGGAAGTGLALMTGPHVVIPSETPMTFTVR